MIQDLSDLAYWVGVTHGLFLAVGLAVFAVGGWHYLAAWREGNVGRPRRDPETGRYKPRKKHNSETQ
jgi:hypothetical protein